MVRLRIWANKHLLLFSIIMFSGCLSVDNNTEIERNFYREEQMQRAREQSQQIVEDRESQRIREAESATVRTRGIIATAKRLTNNDDLRIVELEHRFDISNPYAFDKDVLYFCRSDYLYVWQWLEKSFVGSFLPQEAAYQMPYNTEFFVRNVPDVTRVRQRISHIYMIYIGTQTFTRGNRTTEVLAVFDILDFD